MNLPDLLALAEGPVAKLGLAGFVGLWTVKAGGTWLALRWWKQRRSLRRPE
ncbi:hypothetical protein [Allosediminivita pacifica]|uniref:Uncharacterized protein n=1 Tax=Allosediminivita pacifica TaxID=1267769 RepID=A0A2T6B2D8_9RHOB|nr:hypothetical protein [Allosediminivita pacifica]PTX50224.1 hypothetical protein C8N44_10584 [Allosediminivita pacifica]GGB02421.1 hypothetical protein GCM10011324_10800 [Allosediminivita pacifica]